MTRRIVRCLMLLVAVAVVGVCDPYCFRFTWIGPFQDKNNIAGLTCENLREDLTNIPCRKPLVATYNDNLPDTVDLWRNNREQPNLFGCPMTPGQACVKYTYTYNRGVQNITYMCAKVNATNGCYRQRYISGLDVEVCVCSSAEGVMPCNGAAGRLADRQRWRCAILAAITVLWFALRRQGTVCGMRTAAIGGTI